MLVLDRSADAYHDDADPRLRYRLPTGLAPLAGPDGTPQAMLSRGPDGGLLHLRLGATWPAMQPGERPVAFAEGRFRLLLRTPTSRETGRWRSSRVGGAALVDRAVSLDAVEAALAKSLGQRTGDLVEVEAELKVRGLAPAYPWIASVDRSMLLARITALLGDEPATWEEVEAAFLGLTEDTFTWYPLLPRALPAPRDEALVAIAHHAAPELLSETDRGWVPAAGGPRRLDISLAVARVQSRAFGLRWSFSEFVSAQPDPGRHVIDVAVPAPFVAADVSIVNDVPLSPAGVRSIAVEIRTGGPTGVLRHEFRAGEPASARLRFVRETAEELKVRWRARAVVTTAAGPATLDIDEKPGGLMIELNAATVGLHALQFLGAAELFEHLAALEVTVGSRTLALTAAAPQAWAVGRAPPATAAVAAVLSSGERHPLGTLPVGPRGMTLDAALLSIGEATPVVLRPPADLSQRAAYLAVQVDGEPWRTLEADGALTTYVRRAHRLVPPQLRYRTRHVARRGGGAGASAGAGTGTGAAGATAVIAESAWRDAGGAAITVEF